MTTRFWYSWHDGDGLEAVGESTDYELACSIAESLVTDGVLAVVSVCEQPGKRLIARFSAAGTDQVAEPIAAKTPLQTVRASAPGALTGSRTQDERRAVADTLRRDRELAEKRKRAGVPADGYRISYAVALDRHGDCVFVEQDHELARSRAAAERLNLYDSISWRPLQLSN